MKKNTKKYVAKVVKKEVNGQDGFRYQYHIWASDSDYDGYRILSAVGPEGFVIKEHWLSKAADEDAEVKERIQSWHSDADLVEVKKQ